MNLTAFIVEPRNTARLFERVTVARKVLAQAVAIWVFTRGPIHWRLPNVFIFNNTNVATKADYNALLHAPDTWRRIPTKYALLFEVSITQNTPCCSTCVARESG
jgi:hypothetical protein